MWTEEWHRPQAIVWEENGQAREVALYVRAMAIAEAPKAPSVARTLVRQYMDDLGVSLPGLRRLRWIIDGEEQPAKRQVSPEARATAKDRLKLVAG
jgi:hypothetical protein